MPGLMLVAVTDTCGIVAPLGSPTAISATTDRRAALAHVIGRGNLATTPEWAAVLRVATSQEAWELRQYLGALRAEPAKDDAMEASHNALMSAWPIDQRRRHAALVIGARALAARWRPDCPLRPPSCSPQARRITNPNSAEWHSDRLRQAGWERWTRASVRAYLAAEQRERRAQARVPSPADAELLNHYLRGAGLYACEGCRAVHGRQRARRTVVRQDGRPDRHLILCAACSAEARWDGPRRLGSRAQAARRSESAWWINQPRSKLCDGAPVGCGHLVTLGQKWCRNCGKGGRYRRRVERRAAATDPDISA